MFSFLFALHNFSLYSFCYCLSLPPACCLFASMEIKRHFSIEGVCEHYSRRENKLMKSLNWEERLYGKRKRHTRRMVKGTESIIYLLDLQPPHTFSSERFFFRHQISFEISSSATPKKHIFLTRVRYVLKILWNNSAEIMDVDKTMHCAA